MGVPSELDSTPSPISHDGHTNGYPESPSSIGDCNLPDIGQNPIRGNAHNLQLQHGDPDPTQSPVLRRQTSQVESTGSSWTRFEIPTKNESLSSGFPFHPRLYDLKITHDQWHLFSSDIVTASKLSGVQDFLAWTTGITVGTLSTPLLLVFSPWIGYISGRAVHRKTIQKNVKEKLLQEGDLRSILRRWNEETFMPKGCQAWLELPQDPRELHKEYHLDETLESKGPKCQKKAAKKAAKRFRIIIIPDDDAMYQSRSSLPVPTSPLSVRTPVERDTQELPDTLAEPPAYENGIHDTPPTPPRRHYNRPIGFTNIGLR